jgi:hypothetical protein
MKTRYTSKSLEKDVAELNQKLATRNHEYRFVVGGRYGYTAIDLATPEQAAQHCCQRMLIGGTPRECLNECHAYIAAHLV